jgi:hypothetical protein
MGSLKHSRCLRQWQKAINDPRDSGSPTSFHISAIVENLVCPGCKEKFMQLFVSGLDSRERLWPFPPEANVIAILNVVYVEARMIEKR